MNKVKKQNEVLRFIRDEKIQVCSILETHVKPFCKKLVKKSLEDRTGAQMLFTVWLVAEFWLGGAGM